MHGLFFITEYAWILVILLCDFGNCDYVRFSFEFYIILWCCDSGAIMINFGAEMNTVDLGFGLAVSVLSRIDKLDGFNSQSLMSACLCIDY